MKLYGALRLLCSTSVVKNCANGNFAANFVRRNWICISSTSCNQWGSKTKVKHRNIKLQLFRESMADPQVEEVLAPLRASVKEQVRF